MRRALIGLAVSVAAVVMLAAPAGAHATLIQTQPAASQVYSSPPPAIVLRFSESVQVKLGGIRLFDAKGHRIDTGAPSHPNGDGATVSVSLPKLKDGTYVATWRVISADGHPVQNGFTFSVGEVSATGANAQSLANRLLSQQGGSRVVGVINGALRFVEFAATGLLIGAFGFVLLCWPAGRRARVVTRMIEGSWIAAFVGAIAVILIESSYTAGLGLADSFKPSVVRDYLETTVGHVMVLRLVVLLVIFGFGRTLIRRSSFGVPRTAVAGGLSLGLLATFTFAGHARTGFQVVGAVVSDLAHLAAFSLWFGGLVVLVVAVLRPDDPSELEPAVARFSNVALGAVVVLTGTGVYQGWRQVGSFGALKDTTYGRLLLVKVALVAVVVLAAALTRDIMRQRLYDDEADDELLDDAEEREPLPVGPGAALADLDFATRADTARRLRISVGIEVVFLVAVLCVTALLVNAAPARTAVDAPFAATIAGKGAQFELLDVPARTGPNEMHITVLKPDGVVFNVLSVDAEISNAQNNIAPIKLTLIKLGPGHYTTNNLTIPFSGKWTVDIKALVTDLDEVAVTTTMNVRS
ncbi:MAG: copper transport protein [Actinomycetota bacterium]|nr:copper transport protein [Actinomycetota bacterium]